MSSKRYGETGNHGLSSPTHLRINLRTIGLPRNPLEYEKNNGLPASYIPACGHPFSWAFACVLYLHCVNIGHALYLDGRKVPSQSAAPPYCL